MNQVRQWWVLTAWPAIRRAKWFVAAWVVLALVAIPWGVRAEERGLEETSRAALADAGVVVNDISFTGRTALVSVANSDQAAAEVALAGVAGIRAIEWETVRSHSIWQALVDQGLLHEGEVGDLIEELQQQQEFLDQYVRAMTTRPDATEHRPQPMRPQNRRRYGL